MKLVIEAYETEGRYIFSSIRHEIELKGTRVSARAILDMEIAAKLAVSEVCASQLRHATEQESSK